MGMRSAGGCTALILLLATAIQYVSSEHQRFVPLVAFQCGFRNRYMNEAGSWVSENGKYAACVKGKYDILKYCRKAYPKMNITNIVEYAHEVTMADWCKEGNGDACRFTNTVRPFRCIVGEFHSEALQVPAGCVFNHENYRDTCNDYNHWKNEASSLCLKKKGNMAVRSFAMLEPCGLDLFTGVEFVCCPKATDAGRALSSRDDDKLDEHEKAALKDEEEEDDDDDDDDDSYEDEATTTTSTSASVSKDAYFDMVNADLPIEHEAYKEALERLEQKHREKITKVMDEWKELDRKYDDMKLKDAINAEVFKHDMTERFEVTVAALEDDHRTTRRQIENVHEERVINAMNEKKRRATHAYRNALAMSVGKPGENKDVVLKTLKAYIRAEEKDRIHTLNKWRHLLRTDAKAAQEQRSVLLHRLQYIDLRINGTIAMLSDVPQYSAQLSPIIYAFWDDFRRENTPELKAEQHDALRNVKAEERPQKTMEMLEVASKKDKRIAAATAAILHIDAVKKATKVSTTAVDRKPTPATATTTSKPATPATTAGKPAAKSEPVKLIPAEDSDSEEDDDSYYEDENDEELKKPSKKIPSDAVPLKNDDDDVEKPAKSESIIKITKVAIDNDKEEAAVEKKTINAKIEDDDDESDEEDDDDDSDERMLPATDMFVNIQPILSDKFAHGRKFQRSGMWPFSVSGYAFAFLAIAACAFAGVVLIGCRNRRRNIRFVEVDVCSPEERHISGMQVNGYENPTYSFFDSKA